MSNANIIPKTVADRLTEINARVNKAEKVYNLDTAELTDAGLRYLVEYGLKQSLNDAVAGVKQYAEDHNLGEAEAADILADKRLKSILAGTVGTGGGGPRDPLAKHIRTILGERVKGWKDYSAKAKNDTIQKIKDGQGGEAAQAILAEAEKRNGATEEAANIEDLGL